MTEIFNKQPHKKTRRLLRKVPTVAEKKLWGKLRNRRIGYKFKRQFGIGKYIADFYSPKLRFIIEVDGATHSTAEELNKDRIRQEYFENLGLTIKRYNNSDIYNHIDNVIESIINTCKQLDKKKNNN